jgi:hypothetical protein
MNRKKSLGTCPVHENIFEVLEMGIVSFMTPPVQNKPKIKICAIQRKT